MLRRDGYLMRGSAEVEEEDDLVYIKRAAAKIVPKLLHFEQKQRRMDIAQEMLMTFNDDPDLVTNHGRMSRRVKNEKITSSSAKCEDFSHCFLRLQWRDAS